MSTTSSAESSGAGSSDSITICIPSESQPLSSTESGLTLSPSILTTSTGTNTPIHSIHRSTSTKSLPAGHVSSTVSLNTRISFAPLPNIEPRKRRSSNHIKLGVGARSEMMRQRRIALQMQAHNENEPRSPNECEKRENAWQGALKSSLSPSGGELWQDQQRSLKKKSREPKGEDGEPDPFIAMARLMKSAWRKVSSPHVSPSPQAVSSTTPRNSVSSGASEKSDTVKASVDSDRIVVIEGHSQEEGDGDKETVESATDEGSEHDSGEAHALSPTSYVVEDPEEGGEDQLGELGNGHAQRPPKPMRTASEPHDLGSMIWLAAAANTTELP